MARRAESLLAIEYEPLESILDVENGYKQERAPRPGAYDAPGRPEAALRTAPHLVRGELRTGREEHCISNPRRVFAYRGGGAIKAYSSTQHPSETQAIVAEVLGVRRHDVVVEVRRLGGGSAERRPRQTMSPRGPRSCAAPRGGP